MEQRRRFKRVELSGMLTALAGLWITKEAFSDEPLVQVLVLLPGLFLLGAACVLHLRLPREQRDPVELSWRLSPVHVYLFFLLVAVLELAYTAQLIWGKTESRFADTVALVAVILFFAGEGIGYFCYFRQKKSRKKHRHHKKKRGEDPWD